MKLICMNVTPDVVILAQIRWGNDCATCYCAAYYSVCFGELSARA